MCFIYNSRKVYLHRKHAELSFEELTQTKHQLIVNVQQFDYRKRYIFSEMGGISIPTTSSIA